jgi:hypothetical protein
MTRATRLDYGEWMQAAFDLDRENRELRVMMWNLFVHIAKRDELVEVGLAEIERQWGEAA